MQRARNPFLLLLLLSMAATSAAQETSRECPPPATGVDDPAIEVVPCNGKGDTTQFAPVRGNYVSSQCKLPDDYSGGEARYKLRLNGDNNNVGFRLTPAPGADLVLVLLNDKGSCVASSIDNVGSLPEEIAARHYQP